MYMMYMHMQLLITVDKLAAHSYVCVCDLCE